MSQSQFFRIEVRLMLHVAVNATELVTDYPTSEWTIESAGPLVKIPLRSVQLVERLNDLPVASVTVPIGDRLDADVLDGSVTQEYMATIEKAAAERKTCFIVREQITYDLETGKQSDIGLEYIFVGFIVTPTRQFMRGDAGVNLELRHIAVVLTQSQIVANYAIETPENEFSAAALWGGGRAGDASLPPGSAELIINRLGLRPNTLKNMIDLDVFEYSILEILKQFSNKSIPRLLQNNWSACSQQVNQPTPLVSSVLSYISVDARIDNGAFPPVRISDAAAKLIASKMYDMVCRRTIRDFAGSTFWDKLLEAANFFDLVIAVDPAASISARDDWRIYVQPLRLCMEPNDVTEIAVKYAQDVRWSSSVNSTIRGVVLETTRSSPTNAKLPKGVRTYGCYIDNTDPNAGSVRHFAPPPWLADVWTSGIKAGNAANASVGRGGTMDAVVASMSAAYDAGYFHSGGHNVTLPEAKAIADVARDEFSKILDSYAKRMYIIAAFGGSQLTYSTQYIGPLDFDKTEYVMDATADPNAPIRSGKFTAPVKLNTWVMLPFQQINSRYTRNSNITELYGLVVGKTTIYSRENATRTINYQLDYVMSKADYTKYAHEHPIYFDYVGKKIEAV